MKKQLIKTIVYTVLALLAFAGNSVLCRLALGDSLIDAASFSTIRLLSGIIVLAVILTLNHKPKAVASKGSWLAALMLFVYALSFSYAYLSLDTGTGALILFATVQFSMIFANLLTGNKLRYAEWLGLIMAFSGFVYFVLPSLSSPSLTGSVLMTVAGVAWAGYTLKGRGSKASLHDTAYNFIRTTPFLIILILFGYQQAVLSQQGVLLAVLSGAITSGIGYAIWYRALSGLSVTQAAVVQLCVPVIATMGGVIFASETVSIRLVLSSIMILGGILLVVLGRGFSPLSSKQNDKNG